MSTKAKSEQPVEKVSYSFTLPQILILGSGVLTFIGVVAGVVLFLVNQINRLDTLEESVARIETEIKAINSNVLTVSDLLDQDLMTRYYYRYDPSYKNKVPHYDPGKKTIFFEEDKYDRTPEEEIKEKSKQVELLNKEIEELKRNK